MNIHIPEGATPKDGPSAGITMVTALLSLLNNIPIKSYFGMTGELTLTGKILPIGGVPEKITAAKRAKLRCFAMPEGNRSDYEKLPSYVKKDIKVFFVSHYDDVFSLIFNKRG